MSVETCYYRGSAESVREAIRGFVGTLAGHGTVGQSLVYGVQLSIAGALLDQVSHAFVDKSRGGTGSDGIKWKPLERETIAARRQGPETKKAVTLKARAAGFTVAEQRRMAKEIKERTAQLTTGMMVKFGLTAQEAQGRASGLARSHVENRWRAKIKVFGGVYDPKHNPNYGGAKPVSSRGALTYKIDILGSRTVDILHDTGILENSFSVGVDGVPSGAEGQIVRITGGRITVGTNVKTWHHNTKAHWRRPFWPDGGQLPDAWWNAIERTANRVMPMALKQLLASGPGAA